MSQRRTTTAWVLGAAIAAVATPLMLAFYYGVAIDALVAAVLVGAVLSVYSLAVGNRSPRGGE